MSRTIILGIGNRLGGGDAAGPPVVDTLNQRRARDGMPLSMFISYVEESCGKVLLIGVQPERTEMGGPISKAVRKSMMELVEAILEGQVAEIPRSEEHTSELQLRL